MALRKRLMNNFTYRIFFFFHLYIIQSQFATLKSDCDVFKQEITQNSWKSSQENKCKLFIHHSVSWGNISSLRRVFPLFFPFVVDNVNYAKVMKWVLFILHFRRVNIDCNNLTSIPLDSSWIIFDFGVFYDAALKRSAHMLVTLEVCEINDESDENSQSSPNVHVEMLMGDRILNVSSLSVSRLMSRGEKKKSLYADFLKWAGQKLIKVWWAAAVRHHLSVTTRRRFSSSSSLQPQSQISPEQLLIM